MPPALPAPLAFYESRSSTRLITEGENSTNVDSSGCQTVQNSYSHTLQLADEIQEKQSEEDRKEVFSIPSPFPEGPSFSKTFTVRGRHKDSIRGDILRVAI